MKNEHETRSLVYNFTKIDKASGSLTIHSVPDKAGSLVSWLGRLPVDIEYRGEGMPNLTHKV